GFDVALDSRQQLQQLESEADLFGLVGLPLEYLRVPADYCWHTERRPSDLKRPLERSTLVTHRSPRRLRDSPSAAAPCSSAGPRCTPSRIGFLLAGKLPLLRNSLRGPLTAIALK